MSFIDWSNLGVGLFMTAATHPISYCKVLIQLGHEPLSPVIRRNIFFRKQLQYPSVFQYLKHIKDVDGKAGLYRGLTPRLCANLSTTITYMAVADAVQLSSQKEPINQHDDAKTVVIKIAKQSNREMITRCCAVIVSQPFHVIAIRSMAQFVGHETYYNGIMSSVKEIYQEEGVLGFFVGMVPRLLGEVLQIWLCNVLAYFLNTYVLNDQSDMKDLRQYSQAITSYIASAITYPLNLASTVIVVSGSRLEAGNPPHMPVYERWTACLCDLRKKGLSSRGSSLFFRKVVRHAINSTAITPMPPPPMPK